jgi:hypothetical protein
MGRRSYHSPADCSTWRRFGAALAAFALAAQLVLSGAVIGGLAAATDQADDWVVCTHDAADQTGSSKPQPAKSHDCLACIFAQTAKLAPTLPAPPVLQVLQGRAELMLVRPSVASSARHSPSPYSSRAPPSFT